MTRTVKLRSLAKINPIRFSTQYADDNTSDLKYLYRDYRADTGRWLTRDPLGEKGGRSLYNLVSNNAVNLLDKLGLCTYGKVCCPTCEINVTSGANPDVDAAIDPLVSLAGDVHKLEILLAAIGTGVMTAVELEKALELAAERILGMSSTDAAHTAAEVAKNLMNNINDRDNGFRIFTRIKFKSCVSCTVIFWKNKWVTNKSTLTPWKQYAKGGDFGTVDPGRYEDKISAYRAATKACADSVKEWNDTNKDSIESGQ